MDVTGDWKNGPDALVIAQDGSFALRWDGVADRGRWQLQGNQLWLGSRSFRVSFRKNRLYLDKRWFAKVESNRSVPPKLVGVWGCMKTGGLAGGGFHIHRVLELRGDGTFRFLSEQYQKGMHGTFSGANEDSGHWWLEGSRLYFNGNPRQLDLRDAPNGTPMIVLDGDCYVSKERRPSWGA